MGPQWSRLDKKGEVMVFLTSDHKVWLSEPQWWTNWSVISVTGQSDIPGLAELRVSGMSNWHPNRVRLAPNGTNLGVFKISFSTFWLAEPKCTETDLKNFKFVPFEANLT